MDGTENFRQNMASVIKVTKGRKYIDSDEDDAETDSNHL